MYSQKPCYLLIRQPISWECWFCDAKLTTSIENSKSSVAKTHGVTNNIKTNTSPGGLADRHSRQPKLPKSLLCYVLCLFLVHFHAFCIIRIEFGVFVGTVLDCCNYLIATVDFRMHNKVFLMNPALAGWG